MAMAMPASSNEDENIDMDKLINLISVNAGTFSSSVLNNDWDTVLNIYDKYGRPEDLQGMKITRSEERALHMALRMTRDKNKDSLSTFQNKKKRVVKKLMDGLQSVRLAELVDDRGNAPLHLAAKMEDQQEMCMYMAKKQPDGIGDRNHENDTPLFLAALYGCRDSFPALSEICCSIYSIDKIYQYGRRSNEGSTILHCAVNEEFFDLACEIIRRFPEFVHHVDHRGYSPLHLLARKPTAFKIKSSWPHIWRQSIIHHCQHPCRP